MKSQLYVKYDSLRKQFPKTFLVIHSCVLFFFIFILYDFIFPFHAVKSYSTIIEAEDGKVLSTYLSHDEKWRMKVELNEISDVLEKTIIYKEDKYFYYHPGVNLVAVLRALTQNVIRSRRVSGASTITMQVARMLSPRDRTYFNKLKDILHALQLEWHYSKKEILAMYLNLVPYGGNIEGVKSASVLYFDKTPQQLSIAQVVALSIIPNRPTSLAIGKNNDRILVERNRWLQRMQKDQLFESKDITDALAEPLSAQRVQVPHTAPQLCHRLKIERPWQPIIHSHIVYTYQRAVEEITRQYIQSLAYQDIHNAAVIIIDNHTHHIVSYVGSQDFEDKKYQGEVDGVQAVRSPGSALKPLLYGIAFDKGLLTPKSVIEDVAINYDGYSPENYDRTYNGYVTARYALHNSLNVPAVKIFHELGTTTLIEKLIDLNFKNIKFNKKKLGLSTVLGGCGVSLEELSGMYSMIANEGLYHPPVYTKEDSTTTSTPILSQASTFLLTDILSDLTRPDFPNNFGNVVHLPQVAWKTGTSYGRRDAWAVGYNKSYTVAVWVGNFDGTGVSSLNGADIAVPLLFKVFNHIDYNSQSLWNKMPSSLDTRIVCTASGLKPGVYCEETTTDYYIPTVSSNTICTHRKRVELSMDSSYTYCNKCLPTTGYISRIYPNLSAEMISYYTLQHIPYAAIPPHNPVCSYLSYDGHPQITSLLQGKEYLLEKDDNTMIQLSALLQNDATQISWWANQEYIGTTDAGSSLFYMPTHTGGYTFTCTDDKGRSSEVSIRVVLF